MTSTAATAIARAAWLLAVFSALCAWHATGAAERPAAREVEAAYVVNFLRYTQWPPWSFADRDAPYVIAVVGSTDTIASMRTVTRAAGRINGRPIDVRGVRASAGASEHAANELDGAHLVFFDQGAADAIKTYLPRLSGKPVLTVSDVPGFARDGGMLELITAADHIVFAADPSAIAAAGLVVSAKVLKLARTNGDAR